MNLLLTGAWSNAQEKITEIENIGHKVVFLRQEKDKLPCDYKWIEGVICNGLFLSHPIERFVNLRYIQLTSAGLDRIPLEYVKEHNIELHNAGGVYSIPMAEFAITGVLQLYKEINFFHENQKLHKWEKHRGLKELNGKTVCIIGCGSVGTECAKRFKAFGCKIIGVDLSLREDKHYSDIVIVSELETVLPKADIIILTVPLTTETKHLLNLERMKLLKQDSLIVNIARGGVVDTDVLQEVLPRIGGAILDVFEDEPLDKHSPLWEMENVIITPHNSFVGENNSDRLSEVILTNLEMQNE